MGYEYIDISGDAGIKATGATLEELFTDTALGMYSLVTDAESIKGTTSITTDVTSRNVEGLLVAWLNELIFHLDARGFVGKGVRILRLNETEILAEVSGEEFDPERHERRLLLKAATYHDLKVKRTDGGWLAEVIFDI